MSLLTRCLVVVIVLAWASAGRPTSASGGRPAQSPPPQEVEVAPRVAVRVQPPKGAAATRQILDAFDFYFEPTIKTFTAPQRLDQVATALCGHVDNEWVTRVKRRNNLATDLVTANTTLTLPPCPFYSSGGTIRLQEQDAGKVRSALLREVGVADPQTVARVAAMNKTTPADLERMDAGRTLNVDFVTIPVSHVLKPQFKHRVSAVVDALNAVPSTLSARPDIELSLVIENQPECDAPTPVDKYPFDSDAVADVLEFNAAQHKPRLATVGVIDTGIDRDEARLFLSKTFDGSIGANMDPNRVEDEFPTTPSAYTNRDHGTHVAGLVLGGLRSPRLSGLVRDRIQLRIINIVSEVVTLGPQGLRSSFPIPLANLDAALTYSGRDPRIPILNLSVETTTRHDAMLRSFADGDYLAVVAAGNTRRDIGLQQSYPAAWRAYLPTRFLTVAAVLPDGRQAPFSNHGPEAVDIAAPGCSVPSLLPSAREGTMSGTSQAAPLVSFTAALLYSEGLPPQELRNRIRASVRLVEPPLRDRLDTMGILDIPKAISVHEDLVTLKSGEVKRGRVQSVSCLHLLDDCWPIERISRIVAPGASGGSRALAWLYGDDGNVVVRSTGMPPGSLRIRLRGGSEDTAIPFEHIAEVMFAVRKRR